MKSKNKTEQDPLGEIARLKLELQEARETLDAIRRGEIDAVLVSTPTGDRIYTLKTAEQPYRVFFEAMNEGAVTMTTDGFVLFCNTHFSELVELPIQKLLASQFLNLVKKTEREGFARMISRAGSGKVSAEILIRGPMKKMIPVNISLSPLKTEDFECVCAVITDLRDVAAMKQLERMNEDLAAVNEELRVSSEELIVSQEQLREAEQRAIQTARQMEAVIDQLSEPVLIYNERGELVRVNRTAMEALGVDPLVAGQREVMRILGEIRLRRPGQKELSFDQFPSRRALRGEEVEREQMVYTDIVGQDHMIVTSARPLTVRDKIIGSVVVWHDITERVNAEEAIAALNADLLRRNSDLENANRELEAFAYSISHDLRAPLRAIEGMSEIILEDYAPKLDAEGRKLFSNVQENAKRMDKLITGLLSLSRVGRHTMKASQLDFQKLVSSVINELRKETGGKDIRFTVKAIPSSRGDSVLIRQVFVNLLSNAVKFTRDADPAEIEVGGQTLKGEKLYYVKDNGVGFDMKYAEKMFTVFQRLHGSREFEGTGVGLSIVQRVIERHGGRVWATSKPGQGSTFYFTLPRK